MEFSKLGLENFTEKNLFTEIFRRMIMKNHPEISYDEATKIAENGYDNADDEIDDLHRRINEEIDQDID
jgi:hypothetical protein